MQNFKDIKLEALSNLETEFGSWEMRVYSDLIHGAQHVALIKGIVGPQTPTLVRVHSECLTGDAFESKHCDCGAQLKTAMQRIDRAGAGIVLYLRQEGRGIGLINKIKAYSLQHKQGLDTVQANEALGLPGDMRDYRVGAQILAHIGVQDIRLLTNNPKKIHGITEYGLNIIEQVSIEIPPNGVDNKYLETKKEKMGHLLTSADLRSGHIQNDEHIKNNEHIQNNQHIQNSDIVFMKRALQLARYGFGHTSPNPTVGAVVVRDGKIIGEGWHKKAGTDHAEIVAFKSVKNQDIIRGSVLYTTLEPCNHFGKTPPCTDSIIRLGVSHVVVGMQDPHSRVNGAGIVKLRQAGVRVSMLSKEHSLYEKIQWLNQPYIKWAQTSLPYVTLKAAVTLDGKIATRTKDSKWITNEESRKDARLERSMADAVLVGAGTVACDDPELAPHGPWQNDKLIRIIIDRNLSSDVKSRVFRDKNVMIICSESAPIQRRELFKKLGIRVHSFGTTSISIKKLLQFLGKEYIQHVYVEGGSNVHGMFYDDSLVDPLVVDQILFYIAPKIIGGGAESLSAVGGAGVGALAESLSFSKTKMSKIGDNVKIRGIINVY